MIELGPIGDEFEPVETRDEATKPRNIVDWVNYSWFRGYTSRFGLYSVDMTKERRTTSGVEAL